MAKPSSTTIVPDIPQPVVVGGALHLNLEGLNDGQRTVVKQFLCGIGPWLSSVADEAGTLICRIKGSPEGSIERLHRAVTNSLSRPRHTAPRDHR